LRDVDPALLLRLIETERITEMFLVPAVLMVLLATPGLDDTDLSSLRLVFYGASPISEDVLVKCMAAFGCGFCQVYGMTETTGAITWLPFEDHDPDGPRRGLAPGATLDEVGVIGHCREHLAHYKCPTSVDTAEALPRNPSGKILKRELRAPYWAGQERAIH